MLRTRFRAGFLTLCTVLLLWQIPKTLQLSPLDSAAALFGVISLGTGILCVALYRLWKQPPMVIGLLALLWIAAVCLTHGSLRIAYNTFGPCAYALLLCFPCGLVCDEKQRRPFLRVLIALWTLWMTCFCAAGLYAAFTGTLLRRTSAARFIGINAGDNRLYLMDYCTNAAGNIAASILLAVIAAVMEKSRLNRALYGLCAAVMVAALSLTDARTSFIMLSAGLAMTAGCAVWHTLRAGKAARVAAVLACGVGVTIGGYLLLSGLTNALGAWVPGSGKTAWLTTALAEDGVTHRSVLGGNPLTYRTDVWRGVLALLRNEPQVLLTGTGPQQIMTRVMPYVVSEQPGFDHVHSIYLQMLVSYGLPGFGLMAAFLVLFIRSAWRVLFRGARALWQRLLPVPALAILLGETVECLTLALVNGPILAILFLSMGLTFGVDRSR